MFDKVLIAPLFRLEKIKFSWKFDVEAVVSITLF